MTKVLSAVECQCEECNCREKFERIDRELLLNLITHGRVDEKRARYLTNRAESNLCRKCYSGDHKISQY